MNMPVILASLGFPIWLRVSHYINLLFIGLMIRSGIQILAAHPRLYFNENCKPGSQWIKFSRKKPPKDKDKLWTSMDEEVPVSPWLALPGKDNLGLGRHWHFFVAIFWLLNGIIYIVLLFTTGEWARLIPTSWDIVPRAWQTLLTYLSFHIPPASDFRPYDPLQQLAYAAVVFLLGPFMLLTGAAMSPSLEARFPWYVKLFGGKQSARSLHFLSLIAFILFIIVHTALVLIVHFQDNIRNIVFGTPQSNVWLAILIAIIALVVVAIIYVWSALYSLRHRRRIQHALGAVVEPVRKKLLHRETSQQHYKPSAITSYFWVNGRPPEGKEGEEYLRLARYNFEDWKLNVSGLVEQPLQLSLDDLRAMPKQSQITKHNCIQGWSGVAEWAGVSVSDVLNACQPKAEAHFLVFTSYQHQHMEGKDRPYYEVIDMTLAKHPQTILAYEMNGETLPITHGAPLRLRVETQLGYKMVKYLRSIELVAEYSTVGEGQGGYREDVQYYGIGAEI